MLPFDDFEPDLGQEVCIVSHLGIYTISAIDSLGPTVSVTNSDSGASLAGVAWDQLVRADKVIESLNEAFPDGAQRRKEVLNSLRQRFREVNSESSNEPGQSRSE